MTPEPELDPANIRATAALMEIFDARVRAWLTHEHGKSWR